MFISFQHSILTLAYRSGPRPGSFVGEPGHLIALPGRWIMFTKEKRMVFPPETDIIQQMCGALLLLLTMKCDPLTTSTSLLSGIILESMLVCLLLSRPLFYPVFVASQKCRVHNATFKASSEGTCFRRGHTVPSPLGSLTSCLWQTHPSVSSAF